MLAFVLSCACLVASAGLPTPVRFVPVVYVDPAGNDTTGDGTAANPFRTLQRGHDVVDAGGTVLVRAGAYPFAVAISKSVAIERDGTGMVTLGPPDVGTLTVAVGASDVTLRDLSFAGGGSVRGVELTAGDRLRLVRCAFTGTALGAVRIAAAASAGHQVQACTFAGVRAAPPVAAVAAQNASGLVFESCSFAEGDIGVRLQDCAGARLAATTFTDHFQSALVATASADLVVERCRFTRCGHFAAPAQAAVPAESLGAISLVNGAARARVTATVVEDCGGYTGKNTFRAGATTLFDGMFGLAVLDSADVLVQDCSLHRNRFGGVWVGGTSTGVTLSRCNFVANGSDNDPGKDVAVYSDGLAVAAGDCFFGIPGGPAFDGSGFGNGVLGGTISTVPHATAPFDAPAFGVTQVRRLPVADRAVALAVRDLTGDGWNEIIAAGDRSGTVEVHVNAAGTFGAPIATVVAGSRLVAVVPSSFDADAHVDVAVLDEVAARAVVLFGDGTGTFPSSRSVAVRRHPVRLVAGEVNGVAGADLVVACQGDAFGPGGVEVLRNDGTGQFTASVLADAIAPCAVALLDLDADGDLDLVAFDLDPAGPGLRRWLNDGTGGFGPSQHTPVDAHPVIDASLAVFDQDGGPLDLAVASFRLLPLPGVARVRLFRADGAGGLLAPVDLRARAGPLDLHAAPLAGAARPTLFAVDRSARTVVALGPMANDAPASFPYAQTFGDTPLQIAVGALTNRTTADVALSEGASGTLAVLRGRRAAVAESYGTGCTGTSGVPRMRWSSVPEVGSATFAVGFDQALAGTGAVVVLGAVPLDLQLPGGCRLLVDMLLTLGTVSDASGAGSVPFAIPAFTGLLGASLFGQWFLLDAGGGLFGALATTPGIRIVIGG